MICVGDLKSCKSNAKNDANRNNKYGKKFMTIPSSDNCFFTHSYHSVHFNFENLSSLNPKHSGFAFVSIHFRIAAINASARGKNFSNVIPQGQLFTASTT